MGLRSPLLVALVLVLVLALAPTAEPKRRRQASLFSPDVTPALYQIIKDRAPIIIHHPEEEYFPLTMKSFLQAVTVQQNGQNVAGQPGELKTSNLNFQSDADAQNSFLVTKEALGRFEFPSPSFTIGSEKPTTYALVVPKAGGITDVVYVIFYGYRRGPRVCTGQRQGKVCRGGQGVKSILYSVGDFEYVTLRLKDGQPQSYFLNNAAGQQEISIASPGSAQFAGNQLVVYASLGSHAMYATEGSTVVQTATNGDQITDDRHAGGKRIDASQKVKATTYNAEGKYPGVFAFLGWKGRFGHPSQTCNFGVLPGACVLNNGPTGPALEKWITSPALKNSKRRRRKY